MTDRPTDHGPDSSGHLDQDFASLVQEEHTRASGRGKRECHGEWSGKALWESTQIVRLLSGDVGGESGVEGVYQRSLLPIEMITAIKEGRLREYQQALKEREEQRGGMLHDFNTPPLLRKKPEESAPSICEQIKRDLAAALEMRLGGSSRKGNRVKSIYEGKALISREGPRRILAWATWTRSQIASIDKRTPERDQHVAQLLAILKSLRFDAGVSRSKLEEEAGSTIIFDTLNADPDVQGAASLLCCHLCTQWLRDAYSRVLLWRHKGLQMVDLVDDGGRQACAVDDAAVPQGNNDASQDFFRQRGFSDIGTRYSCLLAQRKYVQDDKTCPGYVLSTEGWMAANLGEAAALSSGIDKNARAQFGANV